MVAAVHMGGMTEEERWRGLFEMQATRLLAELAIFQNNEKRRVCEVIWRRGKTLGVKFVS
jgi:hypothetical protein